MLITRTTTPSFTVVDLTTLAQWLRIDPTTDAATVEMLLASATDYIEGQTGRVLAAADYTVSYDHLEPCLSIGLSPLNSITSVVATAADGTTTPIVAGTDYLTQANSASPSIMLLNVPANTVSITVAANAGYTSADAVPASIQHAAAVLVGAGYDVHNALDPQTIATVAALVARYRRVRVG